MTFDQILAFSLVGAVVVMLVWDKLRYDIVAVLALLAAVLSGLVPAKEAFAGFADDIVIIIASALIVSAVCLVMFGMSFVAALIYVA